MYRDYDYYDQDKDPGVTYQPLASRRVRAKNTYTCIHCKGMIPKGTYHVYSVYLVDGEFHTDRSHTGFGYCGRDEYESDPADDRSR